MSDEKAVLNTDREIWRERPDDFYADSIHVTEGNGIGLNVGGHVIVKPIRDWFKLAELGDGEPSPPPAKDQSRCAVCGWPLADSRDKGCRPGDCSMRPLPTNAFDPNRANTEYTAYKLRPRWAESGAAQEVSPRIISRETFPELGGETTVEVFAEISPPSPEPLCSPIPPRGALQPLRDAIYLIHSEANRWERVGDIKTSSHWRDVAAILSGNLLAETVRLESQAGDTRELKAALRSIVEGAMTAELDTRCHICRPGDDHRHEEGCPILLAERLLK